MPHQSNRELWLSFAAAVIITLIYMFAVVSWKAIPGASDFLGHSFGILGFVLMLMTETLYSFRKRSNNARLGRMSDWMQFHIFTGLVGPFLVLLHSSWKFNGLAGLVMLFTILIVASGFVGRYIYTAVPRTADGIEYEAKEIEAEIMNLQSEVDIWLQKQPKEGRALARRLVGSMAPASSFSISAKIKRWVDDFTWWYQSPRLDPALRQAIQELKRTLLRRETLNSQLQSLATARRLLAIWHGVHIPIGLTLFTAAFIHIGAAIYYATLLK
jgi:hypothetical protein